MQCSQDPYPQVGDPQREDNYNCRGSPQRASGASPTSGSPGLGSCMEKMSPQIVCLWRPVGLTFRRARGPWEIETLLLKQGCPTPGPWTSTSWWPVRNEATQQEVKGGRASEASSAAPHHLHYHLNPPTHPPPVRGKIVFHETGPWCQKCWGPLS